MATLSTIKRALAIVAITGLAGCQSARVAQLWPGSKYTEGDRSIAMLRALAYIDQSASKPANFAEYGTDYVYCFYSIAASARDPELSAEAERIGRRAAKRWAASHAVVAADANADEVADLAFGWLAASQLGQDDGRIKPELGRTAAHFTAVDYLQFDPAKEPPPSDIPEMCPHDSVWNPRGATVCKKCGRALTMQSKYDVWLDALITTYTGERYGIQLGAPYREVFQWMPSMRPYLDRNQTNHAVFYDTVYAITHVVYTLNDYGRRLLPRDLLPQEYSFLKRNLRSHCIA